MAVKTLKFKLYNKKRYIKQYDAQCEILRKVWNLCVALYEYCEFENKQKYAIENGRVYSSPKKLEYYLGIWKRFFDKYPEEYENLFFIIDKGENIGQKMCSLSSKKDCGQKLAVLINKFKSDKDFNVYVPKDSKVINSESIANVCLRYGKDLCAHISKRGKEKSSAPMFKYFGEYDTVVFRRVTIDLINKTIKLPIFSNVKFFNSEYLSAITELTFIDDKYKSNQIAITKESDGMYMLVNVNYEDDGSILPKYNKGSVVGIDMGVKNLLTLSNGTVIENPRYLKESERELRILQRKLARKATLETKQVTIDGVTETKTFLKRVQTSAYNKTKKEVTKLHTKVKRQRREYFNTVISKFSNEFETFVLEDLNIKNMSAKAKPKQDENGNYLKNNQSAKRGLNKSISDSSISMFIQLLTTKTSDKRVKLVDAKYTSQTCNCCGHTEKDNRKTQDKFKCVSCGHEANADENAAKNILLIHNSNKNSIKEVFKN